jgi:hypothetical protein
MSELDPTYEEMESYALASRTKLPPLYEAGTEAMYLALQSALQRGEQPRFALGPAGVFLQGPMLLPGLAQNVAAQKVIERMIAIGVGLGGGTPTVHMFECVLLVANYPFERLTPGQLGFALGGNDNGG